MSTSCLMAEILDKRMWIFELECNDSRGSRLLLLCKLDFSNNKFPINKTVIIYQQYSDQACQSVNKHTQNVFVTNVSLWELQQMLKFLVTIVLSGGDLTQIVVTDFKVLHRQPLRHIQVHLDSVIMSAWSSIASSRYRLAKWSRVESSRVESSRAKEHVYCLCSPWWCRLETDILPQPYSPNKCCTLTAIRSRTTG
jgi:hypothetical protein